MSARMGHPPIKSIQDALNVLLSASYEGIDVCHETSHATLRLILNYTLRPKTYLPISESHLRLPESR